MCMKHLIALRLEKLLHSCHGCIHSLGVIGDWRTHFSDALKDEFCAEYHRVLTGSGLEYRLGQREDGTEEVLSAAIS